MPETQDFSRCGLSYMLEICMTALRPQLAATTHKTYRSYCRAFVRWVGDDATLADMTTQNIDGYLAYLQRLQPDSNNEMVLRPRTISAYWMAVAAFCRWLAETSPPGQPPDSPIKYLSSNPFPSRKLPKFDPAIRHKASEQDVMAMLKACEGMENPYRRALSRCVIYLLYIGLARKGEMLKIRLQHLHLDADPPSILIYFGKGQKSRFIIPPDDCIQAVRDFLKVRPQKTEHDYLLCQNNLRWRLGDLALYRLLEDAERRAGLEPSKSRKPHAMRRGGAKRWLAKEGNIETVKKRLGHSKLTTTQIYTESDDDAMAETRNQGALFPPEPPPPVPDTPPAAPPPAPQPAPRPDRPKKDRSLRSGSHAPLRHRLPPERQE